MEKNVIKKNTHGVTGKVTSSSKKKRQISSGVVHINSSFNNTIVTVSDAQGDVITWSSAGGNNFKGSKKSTPYAAQVTAEKAVRSAKEFGLKTASIKILGPGAGRDSAIRAVANLIIVTGIKDVTPVPHNGCKPRKQRRM
jgi:small subunit ribosomal protein S11